jgi:hypothetical protein
MSLIGRQSFVSGMAIISSQISLKFELWACPISGGETTHGVSASLIR